LIIIFQLAGIDFTALGLVAGAIGVGIGLGLQGITNNFISGIIILFERPIKVGDRIEVTSIGSLSKTSGFGTIKSGNRQARKLTIRGDVIKISARATTVVTNDNISYIIPNSDFIDSSVINWSHNEDMVRLNFIVHVAHKENPEAIKKLLLNIVAENPGVLKNPTPDVLFKEIGGRSLVFNLRVWTAQYVHRPNVLKSQLYYSISKTFKEKNITIPFPQRDLHLKSWNNFKE
jgi:small-conductance mechanosensitive channel